MNLVFQEKKIFLIPGKLLALKEKGYEIKNKVCLITGSSSGIGESIARSFKKVLK